MTKWLNGSLDELLGLAPAEARIARSFEAERERLASIEASLDALARRDRARRAARASQLSRE